MKAASLLFKLLAAATVSAAIAAPALPSDDPIELATQIVSRIAQRNALPSDELEMRARKFWPRPHWVQSDAGFEVEVQIRFPLDRIAIVRGIAERGIQNQHQTGRSDVFNPARRTLAENHYAGADIDALAGNADLANEVRPKYGTVGLHPRYTADIVWWGVENFGEGIAVLKADVLSRTTCTSDDSFGLFNKFGDDAFALPVLGPSLLLTTRADYLEAQVWGPVRLADIREFRIPEYLAHKPLVTELARSGVPIYAYRPPHLGYGDFARRDVSATRLLAPGRARCEEVF